MRRILSCISMCFLAITGAHAEHGDPNPSGHDQYHEWYLGLEDGHGNSCCNDQDCRPAAHVFRKGVLYMLIEGQWRWVPKHATRYVTTPNAGGHWCGVVYNEPGYRRHETYCAFLPDRLG